MSESETDHRKAHVRVGILKRFFGTEALVGLYPRELHF